MTITPDSGYALYSGVPIHEGQEIVFASRTEQEDYFLSKRVAYDNGNFCTYVKRTGNTLSLDLGDPPASFKLAAKVNFLSFKNTAFEDVTYYARVMDWEYENNGSVTFTFAIDWFQTYMFDVEYHDSMIDREEFSADGWAKAIENPWRNDVLELVTGEPQLPHREDLVRQIRNHVVNPLLSGDDKLLDGDRALTFIGPDPSSSALNPDTRPYIVIQASMSPSDAEGGFESIPSYYKGNNVTNTILLFAHAAPSPDMTPQEVNDAIKWLKDIVNSYTLGGVSSALQGIYIMPRWMFDLYAADVGSAYLLVDTGTWGLPNELYLSIDMKALSGAHPKLNRNPFRYVRLTLQNGTSKVLTIERFLDVSTGTPDPETGRIPISFKFLTDPFTVPSFSVIPINYKLTMPALVGNKGLGANFEERISYNAFPQLGYAIDGYLSYISGQLQALENNTGFRDAFRQGMSTAAPRALGTYGMVSSAMSGVYDSMAPAATTALAPLPVGLQGAGMTGTGGLFGSAMGSMGIPFISELVHYLQKLPQLGYDMFSRGALAETRNTQVTEAADALKNGDAMANSIIGGEAAHVMDTYIPGSSDGWQIFGMGESGILIRFEDWSPNEIYTEQAGKFLHQQGCTSGRIGIPRVLNYIAGATDDTQLPYWVDGSYTYCRTNNLHVTATTQMAADYISALFNLGCRFLKGSALT